MSHKVLRRLTGLFLTLAISLAGLGPALAAAGALDLTFDTDGKVTTDFGSRDGGNSVALQPDGKIIVAGSGHEALPFWAFALARYNSDGSPDTTFDTDGKVTTKFELGNDIGSSVALQPNGKIIVAGTIEPGCIPSLCHHFALARYNSDGSPDTTFDTDGKVTTAMDFSSNDFGSSVILQPDGKIIVAGSSGSGFDPFIGFDFALARYNSDGSLDPTFDTDGTVTTDFDLLSNDHGLSVALQPDGKIVVAGRTNLDFALVRYSSDGSLDPTFDTDGKVTTDFGSFDFGSSVALQPDGKIVVAGSSGDLSNDDFALARYNSDGSLDITFDTDGKVTTDFGFSADDLGNSVALQPDGKIVVAGRSGLPLNEDFALARYDSASPTIELLIDVKPGRFPNRIELEKNICNDDDNLYVAVLTTPTFDSAIVDTSTLKLGDPLLSGTVSPIQSRVRDVDFDGDLDLALAFSLCELVTSLALDSSTTELVLTGITLEGVSITGKDSVKVVPD